jgi:hypothetical protein
MHKYVHPYFPINTSEKFMKHYSCTVLFTETTHLRKLLELAHLFGCRLLINWDHHKLVEDNYIFVILFVSAPSQEAFSDWSRRVAEFINLSDIEKLSDKTLPLSDLTSKTYPALLQVENILNEIIKHNQNVKNNKSS